MILRPEGEDRRSRIADVLPKPGCRNHKVNDPIGIHGLVLTNHNIEFLVTLSTSARGVPYGIFAKYGSNAEEIPYSVPPITLMFYFSHIVRWKT
jgi:hypothetical protein